MKKLIIKLACFVAVFFISLVVASSLMNKGSTDMTATMNSATLPVVYLNVNNEYINPLHGYTVPMEGNYLRGSITPLQGNREIRFRADLYGAIIAGAAFEVRTMDMTRLIEDTVINNLSWEEDYLYGDIEIKDLIDEDTEYMLIIKLTTSSGQIIRYYARVINRAELGIGEKIAFVRDFSEKTLYLESGPELKEYMETNSQGDNSSFGYVDIHSNIKQLTWGNLEVNITSGKDLQILEIDEKSASILLNYQVEILGEKHNVSEFFRILNGKKRMHLMEYERIMDQIFDEEKNVVVNGKILHGILHEKPMMRESESGSVVCFAQQGQLYSYTPESGVLSCVFAFSDKDNDDARTRYMGHKVKPLSVDESGNISFIVYGYMNRGRHEGQVGVAKYYYDYALNTIEEKFFLPYTKSYQLLEQEIESLSYINERGDFYVLLDGTIYSISDENNEVNIIQKGITEGRFVSSIDGSVIAWQPGETLSEYNEIKLLDLNWTSSSSILADNDCIIIPLGFMDHDIVYGVSRTSDFTTDETGRTVTPMYTVRIQDKNGNILKEYEYTNIYVTNVDILENQINLERMTRDSETGEYIKIEQDQIMNNELVSTMQNVYSSVVTDETETTYQTILRKDPATKTPKLVNPKEVLFEDSRDIVLADTDVLNRYYIYAKNDVAAVYTDASDAVMLARDVAGVVVNKNGSYIWESENRKSSTQITKIEVPTLQVSGISSEEGDTSADEEVYYEEELQDVFDSDEVYAEGSRTQKIYGLCLAAMLQGQDVYKDTVKMAGEMSITDILKENLEGMDILDLTGCDLSDVLYFVSRGYPVMVLCPNREAVVIVGYDAMNTILYNPMEGTIAKMGMNDSRAWFEQSGNKYITYIAK